MSHNITYRLANENDVQLYYRWANNRDVRNNSFSTAEIKFEDHQRWFNNKLSSTNALLLLFFIDAEPVGQLRLDIAENNIAEIDYSVDAEWRGRRLAAIFLDVVTNLGKRINPQLILKAVVKVNNVASAKILESAGYIKKDTAFINNIACHIFYSE